MVQWDSFSLGRNMSPPLTRTQQETRDPPAKLHNAVNWTVVILVVASSLFYFIAWQVR